MTYLTAALFLVIIIYLGVAHYIIQKYMDAVLEMTENNNKMITKFVERTEHRLHRIEQRSTP